MALETRVPVLVIVVTCLRYCVHCQSSFFPANQQDMLRRGQLITALPASGSYPRNSLPSTGYGRYSPEKFGSFSPSRGYSVGSPFSQVFGSGLSSPSTLSLLDSQDFTGRRTGGAAGGIPPFSSAGISREESFPSVARNHPFSSIRLNPVPTSKGVSLARPRENRFDRDRDRFTSLFDTENGRKYSLDSPSTFEKPIAKTSLPDVNSPIQLDLAADEQQRVAYAKRQGQLAPSRGLNAAKEEERPRLASVFGRESRLSPNSGQGLLDWERPSSLPPMPGHSSPTTTHFPTHHPGSQRSENSQYHQPSSRQAETESGNPERPRFDDTAPFGDSSPKSTQPGQPRSGEVYLDLKSPGEDNIPVDKSDVSLQEDTESAPSFAAEKDLVQPVTGRHSDDQAEANPSGSNVNSTFDDATDRFDDFADEDADEGGHLAPVIHPKSVTTVLPGSNSPTNLTDSSSAVSDFSHTPVHDTVSPPTDSSRASEYGNHPSDRPSVLSESPMKLTARDTVDSGLEKEEKVVSKVDQAVDVLKVLRGRGDLLEHGLKVAPPIGDAVDVLPPEGTAVMDKLNEGHTTPGPFPDPNAGPVFDSSAVILDAAHQVTDSNDEISNDHNGVDRPSKIADSITGTEDSYSSHPNMDSTTGFSSYETTTPSTPVSTDANTGLFTDTTITLLVSSQETAENAFGPEAVVESGDGAGDAEYVPKDTEGRGLGYHERAIHVEKDTIPPDRDSSPFESDHSAGHYSTPSDPGHVSGPDALAPDLEEKTSQQQLTDASQEVYGSSHEEGASPHPFIDASQEGYASSEKDVSTQKLPDASQGYSSSGKETSPLSLTDASQEYNSSPSGDLSPQQLIDASQSYSSSREETSPQQLTNFLSFSEEQPQTPSPTSDLLPNSEAKSEKSAQQELARPSEKSPLQLEPQSLSPSKNLSPQQDFTSKEYLPQLSNDLLTFENDTRPRQNDVIQTGATEKRGNPEAAENIGGSQAASLRAPSSPFEMMFGKSLQQAYQQTFGSLFGNLNKAPAQPGALFAGGGTNGPSNFFSQEGQDLGFGDYPAGGGGFGNNAFNSGKQLFDTNVNGIVNKRPSLKLFSSGK